MRTREQTGDLLPVDVRTLRRQHLLRPGRRVTTPQFWHRGSQRVGSAMMLVTDERVSLTWARKRDGVQESLEAPVAWTEPNFGGRRPWFLCPGCSTRRLVLYVGAPGLRCRGCLGLAFPSQRETPADRMQRKAERVKKKLHPRGPNLWPGSAEHERPKGMHAKTYERLMYALYEAEEKAMECALVELDAWASRLKRQIPGWPAPIGPHHPMQSTLPHAVPEATGDPTTVAVEAIPHDGADGGGFPEFPESRKRARVRGGGGRRVWCSIESPKGRKLRRVIAMLREGLRGTR